MRLRRRVLAAAVAVVVGVGVGVAPVIASTVPPAGPATDGSGEGWIAAGSSMVPGSTADEIAAAFPPAADTSRVIPVSGDIAEVVYELGLGDHVVATDISATYPPAAAAAPKVGYQRTLNAETLLSYEPTLVIADDRAGPPEVFDLLASAGVEVVIIPHHTDIHAPSYKVRAVASVLGVPDDGETLVAQFETQLAESAALVAASPDADPPQVMALYLRGSAVQLVFGDGNGIDAVIEAAGGVDAGTEVGIDDYAELSTEAVLAAAPDFFLVTDTGLESVGGIDGLLDMPGLADTPAGANRAILVFEDQYLYGLGPRTGDLVLDLAEAFHTGPADDSATTSTPPSSTGDTT